MGGCLRGAAFVPPPSTGDGKAPPECPGKSAAERPHKHEAKARRAERRTSGEACFARNRLEDLTQEQLGAVVLRVGEEVFWGAVLDNGSIVKEQNTVGNLTGETHLVGDDDHRHA